jgi:hypothetical protein
MGSRGYIAAYAEDEFGHYDDGKDRAKDAYGGWTDARYGLASELFVASAWPGMQ